MEEKIEGKEAETSAMAEVDEAIRGGATSKEDFEAKFRQLEGEVGKGAAPSDIDDEARGAEKADSRVSHSRVVVACRLPGALRFVDRPVDAGLGEARARSWSRR